MTKQGKNFMFGVWCAACAFTQAALCAAAPVPVSANAEVTEVASPAAPVASAPVAASAQAESGLLSYQWDELVVTATRTPLTAPQVPMATQVITRADMARMGAYNVRDVLQFAVGVDVLEAGMTGHQVQIRGMDTNKTLVLVDGRRQAGEDSPEAMNAYALSRLNLANVERIEIIRGAGSALYGSDAMGGVVNIITRKGATRGGYAGVRLGGRENAQYGGASTGRQGKLALDVHYNLTKVRDVSDGGSSNLYGPRRMVELAGDYRFDEQRGLDFGASFMREQLRQRTALRAGGMNGQQTDDYDNNRADYHVRYYGADSRHTYELQSYYSRLGKKARGRTRLSGGLLPGAVDANDAVYRTWVTEAKDSYRMDERHQLTYGAEYRSVQASGTRLAGGSHAEQEGAWATYVQDEWQLTDRLLLVPGARYDHHSSFGGRWSPRVGATYSAGTGLRLKANYGRGYRAPTIFERYANWNHQPNGMPFALQILGNPELEPEKSTSYDVGVESESGKCSGKLSYFHSQVDNLIDYRDIGFRAGRRYYRYENIDAAKLHGVEAETAWQFNHHWKLGAHYQHLTAVDSATGAPLKNRAKQTGVVTLSYTDATASPWSVQLSNRWYRDYVAFDGKSYSYNTTHLVVSKQLGERTRAYVGVDNVFNKRFELDTQHAYDIYGRTWRAGVEFTF